MTWMNNHTRNDFKTFWDTLSPLLRGDYRIWPRWQSEHFQYLLQLTFDAVTKANCGVEERLRASWTDHELPFALYLRSFTHESLSTSSPLGEALSFDLSGLETPLAVCSQLGEDGTIVLIDNPAGLAMMTSALPADDRLLAIATDETWAESVRQLIERADLVVLTASVMKRGVAAELALLRKASAQERTVILLANPPGDLTRAFHEGLHHTTIAANPPQATRDKFAGFPLLIEGWNAREAGATAVLAQAMQTALCVRRRGPVGDPPELPPARFDKSIEAQARHEITLGTGEAEAGHTKIAILRFTAAIYTGYEACSISAMFDACAQLARWSETLSDPLAKDYRMLHQVFSIGTRHGLGAMAACFQGLLPNN